MNTATAQKQNSSNSTGTQNRNSRERNQRKNNVQKYFYGTVEVAIGRTKKWIPIWLQLWSIIIEKIHNLDVLIQEADLFSVDWADVKVVSVSEDRSKWEVRSRSDEKVLAKGAFNSCLMFVAGCRKKLARECREHLEDLIGDLLLEAVQLSKSQEKLDLERAYILTVKAREMATWVLGEYCKDVIGAVNELRAVIRSRKDEINSAVSSEQSAVEESSHATEQVAAEELAAVA